jgi:hypothetical protein
MVLLLDRVDQSCLMMELGIYLLLHHFLLLLLIHNLDNLLLLLEPGVLLFLIFHDVSGSVILVRSHDIWHNW